MEKNRPQVGSGPTYSDSPSDNDNSSITSNPTDTLRTSKNSDAKIIKIELSWKLKLLKLWHTKRRIIFTTIRT